MQVGKSKIALLVACCLVIAFEIWHLRSGSVRQPNSHVADKHKPEFALLPTNEIPSAIGYFVHPMPHAEGWEPTVGDIEDVEANLSQITTLSTQDPNPNNHVANPHQYFRQYLAVVVDGKKTIFLNAFCTDQGHTNDWRKHLVFVYDGGKCFWHATYDPANQKFSDLVINGVG
ncbi:MAG TPA: hypothetical protein VGI45_18505 [Terracidiphilus sp.]|jgi:hypothetical protein